MYQRWTKKEAEILIHSIRTKGYGTGIKYAAEKLERTISQCYAKYYYMNSKKGNSNSTDILLGSGKKITIVITSGSIRVDVDKK